MHSAESKCCCDYKPHVFSKKIKDRLSQAVDSVLGMVFFIYHKDDWENKQTISFDRQNFNKIF